MEKFIFTDQKVSNRKFNFAVELFISAFMSVSFMMCIGDICGLSYSLENAFSGSIGAGLVSCYNIFAETLAVSDFIIIPKLSGGSEEYGIVITLAIAFLCLINFMILKAGKKFVLIIPLVLITVLNVVFGLKTDFFSMMLLIASLSVAYLYMEGGIKNIGVSIAFIALVFAMTIGAFQIPVISDITENPKIINSIRDKAAEKAGNLYYGNNPLGSGDLTQRVRDISDECALEISMDDPHSMYLRGFIGEKYEGTSWQALPHISHYDYIDLQYWLEQSGFDDIGQSGQTKKLVSEEKNKINNVEIKAINADKRYGYVPYEISSDIEGAKDVGGSFVVPEKFKKMTSYSYEALDNPAKDWTQTASKLFTHSEDENISKYLLAESHYNAYVYRNYTYLSEAERKLLGKNFGEPKATIEAHANYKTAISDIRNYLKENYIYTEDLGEVNEEGRFLETFLEEKKGYDVHYASAATLMFRYYGIPARYVEGYILTPEDVEKMKGGEPYELSLERNHAWTEIYIDGMGFVPVEVCPEYEGVMEEADLSIGITNSSVNLPQNQSGASQNSSVQAGGADKRHERLDIFTLILLAVLVIAILVALTFLVRKAYRIIKEKRRKAYLCHKADPKTAVSAIFGFMEEENLPISMQARSLGNMAAYSRSEINDEMRKQMLDCLKQARKEKRESDRTEKKNNKANKHNAFAGFSRVHAMLMRSCKSRRKSR